MSYTGDLTRPDYYSILEIPTSTKLNTTVGAVRTVFNFAEQHQHTGVGLDGTKINLLADQLGVTSLWGIDNKIGIRTNTPTSTLEIQTGSDTSGFRLNGTASQIKSYISNSSTGDPVSVWTIPGVTAWMAGIDNSDSDKFKLAYGEDTAWASLLLTGTITGKMGIGISDPRGTLGIGDQSTAIQSSGIILSAANRYIEVVNSTSGGEGSGYGFMLYGKDEGVGYTSANLATRGASATWVDAIHVIAAVGLPAYVGIGTGFGRHVSSPDNGLYPPQVQLDVHGSIRIPNSSYIQMASTTAGAGVVGSSIMTYADNNLYIANETAGQLIRFRTKNSGGTIQEAVTIDKDGCMGLGTATPGGNRLSVIGSVYVSTTIFSGGAISCTGISSASNIYLSGNGNIESFSRTTNLQIKVDDAGYGTDFYINGNATTSMKLTQNGYLGIGSNYTPSYELDVNGSARVTGNLYLPGVPIYDSYDDVAEIRKMDLSNVNAKDALGFLIGAIKQMSTRIDELETKLGI